MAMDRWLEKKEDVQKQKRKIQGKKKKKKKKKAIGSKIGGKKTSHTKWNTSKRERKIPWESPSLWKLTHDTNDPCYRKETHRLENSFLAARLKGECVEMTRIWRIKSKLLHLEWLSIDILLFSTENYDYHFWNQMEDTVRKGIWVSCMIGWLCYSNKMGCHKIVIIENNKW